MVSSKDTSKSDDDLSAADATDLHRTVREEGETAVNRPAAALLWSGLAAGIAINASLLFEGALYAHLPDAPWRPTVVSLGYPIGFLIVVLGRMQLFTESTITAMLPLATKPSLAALGRTLRLWALVILANLAGTALVASAMASGLIGDDALRAAMIAVSAKVMTLGAGATFLNAIPAGFFIAILAWTLPGARAQSFLIISAITYLVALAGFSHSIVGSSEVFLLIFSGKASALALIAASLIPAILGNLLGGAGIFALLAHAQVRSDAEAK